MPGLDDLITLTITAATTTPSRLGFGTPLLATYHTVWADRVREYKSVKGITDAGFATTSVTVAMATVVFAQNPKPQSVKIGRRGLIYTQKVKISPLNTTQGYVYSFKVAGNQVTYTVGAAETTTTVATALTAIITAFALVTAATVGATTEVTTDAAGTLADYEDFDEPSNFKIEDITVDPGIATDLTAIEAADADGWYGLLLDSQSKPQVTAAAAWIEARKKVFGFNTSDTDCTDVAVTTDVMSTLKASNYARTFGLFSMQKQLNWSAAGWIGNRLPADPGSSTWAFKTLKSVTVDTKLTGAHISSIEGKRGNVYREIAGVSVTTFGLTFAGDYIDVTIFLDWLAQRMKERIFGVLAAVAKVPFTDAGIDLMRAQILAQLQDGITVGGLAASPKPDVLAPKAKDVSATDKANRVLPNITFTATLAGAIHKLVINGTMSV